jgi:hypothetical protein
MTDHEMTQAPDAAIAEQKAMTWYDRVAQTQIKDVDTYLLVGEWLKEIKKVVNLLDTETAPEIQQAFKLHKALIARRKKWADKFEEAEGLAKGKLRHYAEQQGAAGVDLPKIEGVTFSETWTGDVVDESLIPREYLTPDLDKLKAVTKTLKEATSIPGWQAKSVKTVSVRS